MSHVRSQPGEVLFHEFMEPPGLSARTLSAAVGVPADRISEIVRGRRDVTADTAIRLGRYLETDPRFWINLPTAHDLSNAAAANDYSAIRPRGAA